MDSLIPGWMCSGSAELKTGEVAAVGFRPPREDWKVQASKFDGEKWKLLK